MHASPPLSVPPGLPGCRLLRRRVPPVGLPLLYRLSLLQNATCLRHLLHGTHDIQGSVTCAFCMPLESQSHLPPPGHQLASSRHHLTSEGWCKEGEGSRWACGQLQTQQPAARCHPVSLPGALWRHPRQSSLLSRHLHLHSSPQDRLRSEWAINAIDPTVILL